MKKDPDAVLDYAVDWSEWLAESETITDHEVIVPTGITLDDDTTDGGQVIAWLSGGTLGQNYPVTYRITTNQGRTDDRTISVSVRSR